jgi:hypothetical protein
MEIYFAFLVLTHSKLNMLYTVECEDYCEHWTEEDLEAGGRDQQSATFVQRNKKCDQSLWITVL